MKLNESNTTATLNIDASLDANGLESLIAQLMALRAQMQPPVQAKRAVATADLDKHVVIENEPDLHIAALHDGRFRLWQRNSGIGWMATNISVNNAAGIASYIQSRLQGQNGVNLFSQGDGQSH